MNIYKRLLFIYNPHSGKGTIKESLSDIMDTMIKAGFEVTIYPTQHKGDATQRIIDMDKSRYDRIVCSGGDGTLNEVVKGLMQTGTKVPVGYIPVGSTNDFGHSIGIDMNIMKAAEYAVGRHRMPIDIGRFNDNYFVYVAAFGIFTGVSYQTPQEIKNLLGHAAYIMEAAKELSNIPSYRLKIVSDEISLDDSFMYGMVTNSTFVGGIKDFIKGDVKLGDGKFEVMLIKKPKNPIEFNEIMLFLTNIKKSCEYVYTFQTRKLSIFCDTEMPWTLDGEFGGDVRSAIITNENQALEIMVE